jgi:hypothetical protein
MDFAAFQAAIVSPSLKRVAGHWRDARGDRTMPAWEDIKPSPIKAQLPIVWSYKYDPVAETFTGRLAGEKITTIFDSNFRGVLISDLMPASDFGWAYALNKRVVTEPALYRSEGHVFKHLDRCGVGERIVMPLSSDGIAGDGVFGATEYRLESTGVFAPTERIRENEQWF